MRRIFSFIVVLCILFITTTVFSKGDIPKPTSEFFVNDYADVLDNETERYICDLGKTYYEGGGTQVVVLTMKSIENSSVEEFSLSTARQWGIGDKEKDNGVLILLVLDSHDIRIEVGYGLEGVLNDGKCGRIIRQATSMLTGGDYSGGIKQIYTDVVGELENPTTDDSDNSEEILCYIIAFCIVIVLILFVMIFSKGNGGNSGNSGSGNTRNTGGGFYMGGFGGSSGGGFSGGGGSFGGGGAGGKF